MIKILPWILVFTCFNYAQAQTSSKFLINAGLTGQFYINKSINRQDNAPNGYLRMHGSDGTLASVGMGFGASFVYNIAGNISFSIAPTFRLASLETANPQGLYGPERVGIAFDVHSGVQWNLHAQNWLVNNSGLGVGLSLLNIGQDYNTYYTWFITINQTGEYQATTLTTLGVNLFYEKKIGAKFSTKLMVIYTGGNFIHWTPLYTSTLHGNVSVNYTIYSK